MGAPFPRRKNANRYRPQFVGQANAVSVGLSSGRRPAFPSNQCLRQQRMCVASCHPRQQLPVLGADTWTDKDPTHIDMRQKLAIMITIHSKAPSTPGLEAGSGTRKWQRWQSINSNKGRLHQSHHALDKTRSDRSEPHFI